jgi:putative addiction module component (TIGR02574 family)
MERAALVDELLSSLDRLDPEINALWVKEVERRQEAYEAGRMKAAPEEEVFTEA